jgi:hypothetical protein
MWGQPRRLSGGPEVSGRRDCWGSPFLVSEILRWRRPWNPTLHKAKGGAPGEPHDASRSWRRNNSRVLARFPVGGF